MRLAKGTVQNAASWLSVFGGLDRPFRARFAGQVTQMAQVSPGLMLNFTPGLLQDAAAVEAREGWHRLKAGFRAPLISNS